MASNKMLFNIIIIINLLHVLVAKATEYINPEKLAYTIMLRYNTC